jgi:hypothetical protein
MVNVVIAMVTNKQYLKRTLTTIEQVRRIGGFCGKIVLVIGNDLFHEISFLRLLDRNLEVFFQADIDQSERFRAIEGLEGNSGIERSKEFQIHKFFIFHTFFKQFDRVLYIDAGMHVFHKLDQFLGLDCTNKLIAHSDTYPTAEWKLKDQFNFLGLPHLYNDLALIVDPESDYFQTGFMFFDTQIIEEDTLSHLVKLLHTFPNVRTNDQGIICLYFLSRNLWCTLPTKEIDGLFLYDFWERGKNQAGSYIMLKYPRTASRFRSWKFRALANMKWMQSLIKFGVLYH